MTDSMILDTVLPMNFKIVILSETSMLLPAALPSLQKSLTVLMTLLASLHPIPTRTNLQSRLSLVR